MTVHYDPSGHMHRKPTNVATCGQVAAGDTDTRSTALVTCSPCLVAHGAEAGHRVTVTPIGPAWDSKCPCGDLTMRRASKHQANEAGLAHLRAVLSERRAS